MPERQPTLEEMQARIREVTADDSVLLSDPDWFSYTDLSMGIASGLRNQRFTLSVQTAMLVPASLLEM